MINDVDDFHSLVWSMAKRVGMSVPRVSEALIDELFPRTKAASEDEGADLMFRKGVCEAVRRIFKQESSPVTQSDFSDIDPSFRAHAERLKSSSFYVPSLDEYVPVAHLVRVPSVLDEARKYLRQKGNETIAEADRLDELYEAVMATSC